MSESKEITSEVLHSILNREIQADTLQEVDSQIYETVSTLIGRLVNQKYDAIQDEAKDILADMLKTMIILIIKIRLEKAMALQGMSTPNLLSLEKYILYMHQGMNSRKDSVTDAIIQGQTQLLDSISSKYNSSTVLVCFLQHSDAMVGVDMKPYGPFEVQDIATIPFENAQALVASNVAKFVQSE